MTAWEYHDTLVASLRDRRDVEVLTFADEIRYNGRNYPFTRVASRDIMPGNTVVVLRLSYHGDEPLGARTFLHHAHRITDEFHRHGLKYIAYPNPHPTAFELGTRDGLSGNPWPGYDDWMRYELRDGTFVDELGTRREFARWFISSDPRLAELGVGVKLSQETSLLQRCIQRDLASCRIVCAIDVHEHNFVKDGDDAAKVTQPGMYFYGFGSRARRRIYDPLIARIEKLVPVLRHTWISAGESVPSQTDNQGCIPCLHDGSYADFAVRAGIKNSTVLELTSATPEDAAEEAVIRWIAGNCDIVKQGLRT